MRRLSPTQTPDIRYELDRERGLVPTDTHFRAAARLQQSLWRQDRDLPIGAYLNAGGKRIKLGSRITDNAGRDSANFLSPEIAALVRHAGDTVSAAMTPAEIAEAQQLAREWVAAHPK